MLQIKNFPKENPIFANLSISQYIQLTLLTLRQVLSKAYLCQTLTYKEMERFKCSEPSTLETQIDQLVYQLYGLTTEEIALVEHR